MIARWSGEIRIEKSHLQRSSLSADLRPQRSASTSERGWLPQPRSHAVARTPYSSPHFGPSRRSDLSQNGFAAALSLAFCILQVVAFSRFSLVKLLLRPRAVQSACTKILLSCAASCTGRSLIIENPFGNRPKSWKTGFSKIYVDFGAWDGPSSHQNPFHEIDLI